VSDTEWSEPALYARGGQLIEPRMFTEADPMSMVLVPDTWQTGQDEGRAGEDIWGAVTYVGRPRLDRRKADRPSPKADRPSPTGRHRALSSELPLLDAAPADATVLVPGAVEPAAADAASNQRLLANSRTMALASLTSRVTGFLRSILLVAALGAGPVGDAYNGGNTFPNMIYELLLGGVLSSVFIPLLVQAEELDQDRGVRYTQRLLSIATAALGVLTIAAVAAAPLITGAFVPAGDQRDLATVWATVLLPEIFFYGVGAMVMAVLNIRHSYAPGAWAPVLNNAIMILTVIVFWALPGPKTLTPGSITTAQVLVIGIGTTLGIAAQAVVLLPYLRRTGFRWHWRFRAHETELGRMREVGALAGWVLVYVVVSQVGVTVIQKVGFGNHGLTVFTNVDLLFQVPYGILIVSLLTAIMPRMSRAAVRGDNRSVIADLGLSARLSAVAMVPITAGLIALGVPLCVVLFAHGENSIAEAHLFGTSLAWSAFGLFPFALVMLQLRVFYAMRDGRTPAYINIFMVATKVALVLITNATLKHDHPQAAVEWLNIATSVSYVVGAIAGHVLLTNRLGLLGFTSVLRTVIRIGVASAIGAALAYLAVVGADHAFGHGRGGALAGLAGGSIVGLAAFAALAWKLRIPEIREIVRLARPA
jgi:putative peptidoglycan lipid II flippase